MNCSVAPRRTESIAFAVEVTVPVLIANPIYDVVFKYLFDDEKVAQLLLSALLGKELLELQVRPTEVHPTAAKPDGTQLLVLRLRFAATVRVEDGGHQRVLVEVQKAQSAMDVQRFRRYLGSSGTTPENIRMDPGGGEPPLPTVTITFLVEGLEGANVPVLRINRHHLDAVKGDEVHITDPFAETLAHDAIVVQVNRLENRRRTELEQLLEVFDQDRKTFGWPHRLDIVEAHFPERHRDVLYRLLRAGAERKILDQMDVEDDILAALQDRVRETSDLRQALAERHQAIKEKESLIEDATRRLSGTGQG
jgi:hypothetical protein